MSAVGVTGTHGGWLAPPARVLGLVRGVAARPWLLDLVVFAAIGLYIAAMLPTLTRFPAVINDEGREANMFWVASRADPAAERMNAHRGFPTWGTGGLQGLTAGVIFRVAGVGVFQARLTSLVWGLALLALTYLLARQYWGRAAAAVAVVVLAVSDPFLVSTHTLRPDIQVATLVVGSLLLVERAVATGRAWPAVAAGVLMVLSADTHLNSLGFIPFVGGVFLVRQGWTFWRKRLPWLFAAGLGLGALYYLAVRVAPDPVGYVTAMGYWVGVDKAPPSLRSAGNPLGPLSAELERYWDYFGEDPLELALVVAAIGAGLIWAVRGSQSARVLLLGLALVAVFFVVAVSMKSKYYMVLTYPVYAILIGHLLERVAFWISAMGPVVWRTAVAGGVLAALAALVVLIPMRASDRAWDNYIRAHRYRSGQEYTALTDQLHRLAGPGARILAPPAYWIGLKDHSYIDIYVYERLYRQMRMSPAQFLEETRPDFVITDAKIAQEKPVEKILYNELDARATRELIVRHKNYGDVAIYRLRW
ncbi:MAG: glycosyltransferase family 39 protein [Chloroflexota bacterium]